MAKGGSRTYKLRLSPQGIELFIACHSRLALLLHDFIPYGATFAVAIGLLDRLDADEIAAELETNACRQCVGDQLCFVGSSSELSEIMRGIRDRLLCSDRFCRSPPIGRLYIVGLVSFSAAEDGELAEAYSRIVANRPRRAKKELTVRS